MKHWKLAGIVLFGSALLATGCAKKDTTDVSIANTGFDSASSMTDELSQLPQVAGSGQFSSVEALPIEAAPVTQAFPTETQGAEASLVSVQGLSHDQQIQAALKSAGVYSGKIDGKIGPATKRAITEFQSQSGLTADGKVGPKTWMALEKYLTTAPAESGSTDPS